MDLYEKYKDDLEALNFIAYFERATPYTQEEIEDAIIKVRLIMSLQDALNILYVDDCKISNINKLQ